MLDVALRAIAEPRRRAILRLVRDRELSSGEIASHFEISAPAVSQHLGVLAGAGLVTVRRVHTMRLYRARPEGLAELHSFLQEFWDDSLARLVQAVEAEELVNRRSTGGVLHE